jgi:hypothetical protein
MEKSAMIDVLYKFAGIGTFLATFALCIIAWWELKQIRTQFKTTFEDSMTERYREIMEGISTDVWLGGNLKVLEGDRRNQCRDAIYRYFDLSNEQAFLNDKGRITTETWEIWEKGIKSNMARPAFRELWNEVMSEDPGSFEYLKGILP